MLSVEITLIRKFASLMVKYELRHCVPVKTPGRLVNEKAIELYLLSQKTVDLAQ